MNLKTKSRYFTSPNTTSVELLDKPLWIAGNIFMDFSKILSTESLVYWHNKKKLNFIYFKKNYIRMKDYTNCPCFTFTNSLLNRPIGVKSLFKNEIPFRSLVGVVLLIAGLCHVVMCYFITDCSVSYKLSNIVGCLIPSK